MSFCLPREQVDKFVKALTDGEINPSNLAEMKSIDRRNFLAKFVGDADAFEVNALFESKLLLKNQQRGMINWAEKVIGISPKVKADMLTKIEKLQNVLDPADKEMFLSDLVEKKLGIGISPDEAKNLSDFSRSIEESKKSYLEAINRERAKIISNLKPNDVINDGKIGKILVDIWNDPKSEMSKKSLEYGAKLQQYKNYVSELKTEANKMTAKDYAKDSLKAMNDGVLGIANVAKGLWSTLDNSFQLRQGFQLLTTGKYKTWAKAFASSWETLFKQLIAKNEGGILSKQSSAVMDAVKAKAYSHPLAVDGTFSKAKLAIGLRGEEAFPPSFIERIPIAGRLMGASEAAYNASAIRLRVEVGSKIILDEMERRGGKLTNEQLADIGEITNSITGRGSVSLTESQNAWANFMVMSTRFIKSQWNILTAHSLGKGLHTPQARKVAAINTLKTYATLASIFLIAKSIDPDSVDFKNHLGKVKVGGRWLSTPMSSIAQTAARVARFIYESASSDKKKKFGEKDGIDIMVGFFEGKASPIGSVMRDYLRGEMYGGEKPTLGKEAKKTFTPLPIQTYLQNSEDIPDTGEQIIFNALEFIGQSSNAPYKKK